MKRAAGGFTLIEVLVALVILAMLGLMSWRALSAALDSRDHVLGIEQRWQRVARAVSTIDTHLLQLASRNNPSATATPDFQLIQAATGEQRLVFLRADSEQGARLSGFEFKDNKLLLLRWPARVYSTRPADVTGAPLLDGVVSLRWAVFDDKANSDPADDEWVEKWSKVLPPTGVRLRIELVGIGMVEKLYAIH